MLAAWSKELKPHFYGDHDSQLSLLSSCFVLGPLNKAL